MEEDHFGSADKAIHNAWNRLMKKPLKTIGIFFVIVVVGGSLAMFYGYSSTLGSRLASNNPSKTGTAESISAQTIVNNYYPESTATSTNDPSSISEKLGSLFRSEKNAITQGDPNVQPQVKGFMIENTGEKSDDGLYHTKVGMGVVVSAGITAKVSSVRSSGILCSIPLPYSVSTIVSGSLLGKIIYIYQIECKSTEPFKADSNYKFDIDYRYAVTPEPT